MYKKIFCFYLFILSCSSGIEAQVSSSERQNFPLKENLAKEAAFLHYNSSLFFAGEYLYYKFYSLEENTGELSGLSKIGTVEIVNEQGETVLQQKIILEEGLGNGDIFIPTSIPSGNYKLIGYTQWMLNNEKQPYFAGNIAIINPYRGDQSALLPSEEMYFSQNDSLNEKMPVVLNEEITDNEAPVLSVELPDGKIYKKREKIKLDIENLIGKKGFGHYSLSVRKIDTVKVPLMTSAESFLQLSGERFKAKNIIYLPEVRGNIIKGRLTYLGEEEGKNVAEKQIALSIPADRNVEIAETNEEGIFYFNLNSGHYEGEAVINLLNNEDQEKFQIELLESPSPEYKDMEFHQFYIRPGMKEMILDRSVHNQIQNNYFSLKPDTLLIPAVSDLFYVETDHVFDLDAYTRFPTVKETFIEIVKFAGIRENDKGEQVFRVQPEPFSTGSSLLPLLIVDGVVIEDHSKLIDLNSNKIKKISLVRDKYYLGPGIFQGIIIVETMDGDFYGNLTNKQGKVVSPEPVYPQKHYFQQFYSGSVEKKRIPDFRRQLLWEPLINLKDEGVSLDFYTSDLSGAYEVRLNGFTTMGEPVSVKKIFVVK